MKYILVAFIINSWACNNSTSDQAGRRDGYTPVLKTREDSLYHDVMQGHDIAMAKMGKIKKHLSQVQYELDSLKKISVTKINKDYQLALLDLQEDLKYADYGMFKWMDEFEVDSARADVQKRVAYLASEKIKVDKLRDHILSSLISADSLLGR